MSVILNALGNPEPSAEVSQRLRAIDPKLFLRFIPHLPEHWAVCRGWDEQDDRWAEVRSGNADPSRAHDIIGYLPMGCSQAEAPAYLERTLRTGDSLRVALVTSGAVSVQPDDLTVVVELLVQD